MIVSTNGVACTIFICIHSQLEHLKTEGVVDVFQTIISAHMHCTEIFVHTHSQLERLKTEGVVDVFQTIKSAHMQRPGLTPDVVYLLVVEMSSQNKCHHYPSHELIMSVIMKYTYANFKTVV